MQLLVLLKFYEVGAIKKMLQKTPQGNDNGGEKKKNLSGESRGQFHSKKALGVSFHSISGFQMYNGCPYIIQEDSAVCFRPLISIEIT